MAERPGRDAGCGGPGQGGEERQDRNDQTPTNEAGRELSAEKVGFSWDPANDQLI